MLLTLSTSHRPVTDLGFLLMKNPDAVRSVSLSFGQATVFYPEAGEDRCTAALLVEVDPIGLVRGHGQASSGWFEQYVSDRPYAASSLLSVALSRVFGTAMGGRSKDRQALADSALPLEATVVPLPVRGDAGVLKRLFEPLGYEVTITAIPLDPARPAWGDSRYVALTLKGQVRLADLLTHLYVLIPVLDATKHYYVGDDEVEKLLRKGAGWLEEHPEKAFITRRYLKGTASLVKAALAAMTEQVEPEPEEVIARRDAQETALETPIRLNDQRMAAVLAVLKDSGTTSVLDLGCGEGKLLRQLLADRQFTRIVGVEVSPSLLAGAMTRLRLDDMPDLKRKRIELLQGSLVYRDDRLTGFDAAALVEVIEHIEPERLPALEAAIFAHARPATVVVTTPNRDYNALFDGLPAGHLRHGDHRFEWTRGEFQAWAEGLATRQGYAVRFAGIGADDPAQGTPTQMAVFER